MGPLDGIVQLLSGGTPKTSVPEYWNGDIPWYTAKDAPVPSDVFVIDTERSITTDGVANSATSILPESTTIVTARGTVGKLACLGQPMAMNQTCYGIRGDKGFPDYFTYLNVKMTLDQLRKKTHGTVFDTITRQTFGLIGRSSSSPSGSQSLRDDNRTSNATDSAQSLYVSDYFHYTGRCIA